MAFSQQDCAGPVAQSVICLTPDTCLTADPDRGPVPYSFEEIDH